MENRDELSVVSIMNEIKDSANIRFSKEHPDYWTMLSDIILESQKLRYEQNISQKVLSEKMETKQSVISRFENMGRTPNYDFIVRLANSLGGKAKIYLDGDFSVQVPYELRKKVLDIISKRKISLDNYLIDSLTSKINEDYISYNSSILDANEYSNSYTKDTIDISSYIMNTYENSYDCGMEPAA